MYDTYTNAHPNNQDREGDNTYNSQAVYDYHKDIIKLAKDILSPIRSSISNMLS